MTYMILQMACPGASTTIAAIAASAAASSSQVLLSRSILVTVHDLYGGSCFLRPLEKYLTFRDKYTINSFHYQPRKESLAVSGKALAQVLRMEKPHTTDESIHFITHGYGALVLREAFRYVDWDYTKSKIIMFAPPNRGIKYYRRMKDYTGIIPTTMLSGEGTAVEEIATKWTPEVLDERLGKLPKRCFPLIIAGNLNLNPFNQGDYPNDGLITQEETYLPGHFRHVTVPMTHSFVPYHPTSIALTRSFLQA